MPSSPPTKRFLCVNRKAPHGTGYAAEALEAVLMTAAFDQRLSLAFLDDGVYQLVQGQDTSDIGLKHFSATFKALGDFDVRTVYVDVESLEARGLTPSDLLPLHYEDEADDWAVKDLIQWVTRAQLAEIMDAQDVVLSF
ncbi:MAG TPA: sulfurtransferase complex subunit TusC [Gammaproteobacteria bacterium]|jgi:tRNA 2-thiouridine synthesizing protein C|nr:sulfurtransferase complex subunit TusC [Gammaproteobacteria bacterium]